MVNFHNVARGQKAGQKRFQAFNTNLFLLYYSVLENSVWRSPSTKTSLYRLLFIHNQSDLLSKKAKKNSEIKAHVTVTK